jgi:serine/threonine protein kinase
LESLRHPGILQPREAGITGDDQLFIVTEYVEGVTLQAVLTRGSMELDRAWARTREICEALEYAHTNGILHCDLKPDNIMLRNVGQSDERAVVIDFGTAVFCAPDHSIMDSNRAAGAADYMAPDRLGGTLSTATDVYSLALVVFEMLTGVRWRDAEATAPTESLLQRVLPPSTTEDRCTKLTTVFRDASAFDAHTRTRTVAEFQRRLTIALP